MLHTWQDLTSLHTWQDFTSLLQWLGACCLLRLGWLLPGTCLRLQCAAGIARLTAQGQTCFRRQGRLTAATCSACRRCLLLLLTNAASGRSGTVSLHGAASRASVGVLLCSSMRS